MKNNHNVLRLLCAATVLAGATTFLAAPKYAWAQAATPPNVTLDLKDAPIRAALEQIFTAANLDRSIDPLISGYVNLKVTDIPFETALRLILRSSSIPLTYLKEGNVYIVRPRAIADNAAAPTPEPEGDDQPRRTNYEQIELTYIDPADLAQLFGITILRVGVRNQSQGGQGGQGGGGGLGGGGGMGGGGFGGGGGGLGGGGMGGGGLGGGGGGLGGGGFGGGRGF